MRPAAPAEIRKPAFQSGPDDRQRTKKTDDAARSHSTGADVKNVGGQYTQLAIQGPVALVILQKLTDTDLDAIRYYWFTRGRVAGTDAIIARTGYTGEDG